MDAIIIHVVSRMPRLAMLIKSLAKKIISQDISVKAVEVPETNDFLTDSSISLISDAEIVVIDPVLLKYNHMFMESLKWAHCTWAGVENLFDPMENQPPFIVTRHGGDKFCNMMAEYVMGYVLSFEKNIIELWKYQAEKKWITNVEDLGRNRTLEELTVLVLGVGNMGKAVGTFFKQRGSTLYGFSRTTARKDAFSLFDKIECHLNDEILADADYIINTLPSTSATSGILKANTFSSCMKKPIFINVGRGDVIEEDELVAAIENGYISAVVLDVFQNEPLPENSVLWKINGMITPHCAALSKPEHVAENFLQSLLCYKQKNKLPNMVDWNAGY